MKICVCGVEYKQPPNSSRFQYSKDSFDGLYWECTCGSTLFMPLSILENYEAEKQIRRAMAKVECALALLDTARDELQPIMGARMCRVFVTYQVWKCDDTEGLLKRQKFSLSPKGLRNFISSLSKKYPLTEKPSPT